MSGEVGFVNSQIQDESALVKLMHDFRCTECKDMNYKILADRVRYFKEDEEGVGTMCRVMEEMREEAAREAARDASREERLKAIKCMIRFKIPKARILNEGYTEEEYEAAKRQEL